MKKFATHDSFTKQRANVRQLLLRRWHPSEFSVDPTEEVILDTHSPLDLKKKVNLLELSGVTVDAISVATYLRSFPAEILRLDIANELQWNQASLYDADGDVIYYKDNRGELKEITTEERAEIRMTENKRSVA
uniref:Ubiquitin carboxyl-terminal hydrolase 47 C-terminal domain-containing protein n=1 Tax=Amphimedon queenslandica TaxID=400682 RepID=A0A1X7VHM2_AMPQE